MIEMTEKPGLVDRLRSGRANAIREARLARGWSQARLAEEAGTSQQTIDRIERGQTQHSRALDDVLDALQLPRNRRPEEINAIVDRMIDDSKKPVPTTSAGIPLYSMGFDSRLLSMTSISDHPERYIDRPERLQNAPRAYAVSVFAVDEMDPVVREGDILLINPDAPLRLPCEALFRAAHGEAVLLRTVTFRGDEGWVVQRWSPKDESAIDREKWPEIHPVVGKWSR